LKNHLIINCLVNLLVRRRKKNLNRRVKLLALISIVVVLAAVATSLTLVMQSTVKADTTAAVASDVTSTPTPLAINGPNDGSLFVTGDMGFGGPRGHGGFGGPRGMFAGNFSSGMMPSGFGSIQVSSDYTQNVTNIVQNDSDVQNLLAQGYNITSIRPVISTVIDGNGNLVTSATTANVFLQSTTGRALVVVDFTSASVTKIVTTTTTVINK
jgi:hypothetical protein